MSSRRIEIVLAGLLFLVAGLLRMAAPGLTEFKADEARLLTLALNMADGNFALRGISSSVGFPNFPASVWLYSIPVFFWKHPYSATIFTGFLNTLAIAAGYWFVRRYWGISAAFASTLMITVSPWAIIFSRKIWAQNLLPLFIMGWAIGAVLAFVEERPRFVWLHLICLALAIQIHLAAIALLPATLLLLLIFHKRIHWRSLLTGLFLAALTTLPFILYLGRQGGISNLPSFPTGERGLTMTLDAFRYVTILSLGTNIHSLAGPEAFKAFLSSVPSLTIIHFLWGGLIIGGVFWLAQQVWKKRQNTSSQAGLIVLIWLFIPPIFFLAHTTPVFLHYFIATLPAQYIAAGVFFNQILKAIDPKGNSRNAQGIRIAAWSVLIVAAIAQLTVYLMLLNFLNVNATPGGYGVPLTIKMEAVNKVQILSNQSGATEVLIAGAGEEPQIDEFPAEWEVLLRDYPKRYVDVDRSALFPRQGSIVLLDGRDISPPWMGDLYLEAAAEIHEVKLRAGEGVYYLLTLPGGAKPPPAISIDPPYLLANWVNLTGHDQLVRLDAETGIWQVHWRTGDNPDPANYQFFNHLIDEEGQRIGQVDLPAFSPQQWHAGDSLISRFLIPWPASAAAPQVMRTGMYRFPSLENVPLLDVAGNPYVDAATFSIDN